MPTRILEFRGLSGPFGERPIMPMNLLTARQPALTASGTAQPSAAFAGETNLVCVQSDEAVYVAFAAYPEATTDDYRIPAGGDLIAFVKPGWKASVRT